MSEGLVDRRNEAANKVEELRRARGAALLDAGVPSLEVESTLAETRRDVEAIDDALTEQVRRERDLQEQAERVRLAHAQSRLQDAEAKRLDAVERAESAARTLAGALRVSLEATGEIEDLLNKMDVRSRPLDLSLPEMERRLAGRLSVALITVQNRPRFGGFALRTPPFAKPTDNWREAERCIGAAGLTAFLQPNKETVQ